MAKSVSSDAIEIFVSIPKRVSEVLWLAIAHKLDAKVTSFNP